MNTEALPSEQLKPCKVCGSDIPIAAHKCIKCEEWQNRWLRLATVQGKAIVTILPMITLCVGFLVQLKELNSNEIKAFAISCEPLNSAGNVRRYSGRALVLSDSTEPIFLGEAKIVPRLRKSHAVQKLKFGDEVGLHRVAGEPFSFSFEVGAEVASRFCDAATKTFRLDMNVVALNQDETLLRIGSCSC